MKILGLDISSKTGFAVLNDGKLVDRGLIKSPAVEYDDREPDFGILARADGMVKQLGKLILKNSPDAIAIEQTNAGKFRTSQKGLEFTHCLLLSWLSHPDHDYIKRTRYIDTSKWRSGLGIKLTKDQRKHNERVRDKLARGKVTPKHLAVAWANETYGIDLLQKDHDIADAIALATLVHRRGLQPMKVEFDVDSILSNPTKSSDSGLPSQKNVV